MSENNAQNSNSQKSYNLITKGVGYLNRARTVSGKKSYLSVSIAALRGRDPNIDKTFFDLIVTGKKAKEDVTALMDRINDKEKKVFCSFVIADGYPESFEFKEGPKKGQKGHVIKGHLLRISSAFVDGERIQLAGDQEPESIEEDDGVVVELSHSSADAPTQVNGAENKAVSSDVSIEEPDVVKLDKNDPNFEARKSQLKAAGYKWNGDEKAWVKPAKDKAA